MAIPESQGMIGLHLLWADRGRDELISWTDSCLFMIVHAWRRRELGQRDTHVCLIDRRQVKSPPLHRVAFYPALKLIETFEVLKSPIWDEKRERPHLHARKFTYEFLSHGELEYPKQVGASRHVPLEELEEAGLWRWLIEKSEKAHDEEVGGLYTILRWCRNESSNYSSIKPITRLEICSIAWCCPLVSELLRQSLPDDWETMIEYEMARTPSIDEERSILDGHLLTHHPALRSCVGTLRPNLRHIVRRAGDHPSTAQTSTLLPC